MRQLVMMAMVSVAILLVPFDVNAQTGGINQDSCSAVCEAELEECANRPGSLFSRTQAQIDVANECYGKCSREEGDGLEACQQRKYSCWKEILDRKNPDGTWQCMYAGGIDYIKPVCRAEGETSCDGPREACVKNVGKEQGECSDRCSTLESEQTAIASRELCREQRSACLMKDKACQVEALVEKTPSESDLAINENAKRMNEELKSVFFVYR